ncbi:MAG: hypothetical protein WKG01_19680 [Kofleriaceae bacterium]
MRLVILSSFVSSILARGTHAHADAPVDFIDDARQLLVVGACAEGTAPVAPKIYAAHCKAVTAAQHSYRDNWIAPAREFFAAHVPATIPTQVVYPFAGGDLSSVLTVFPRAEEITTLSLEPAGDPRGLRTLPARQVKLALRVVATELTSLYESNFSRTLAMIDAMRAGKLPTQLIFSLSALSLHGYEPTQLRYFELSEQGAIRYLTAADLTRIDAIKDTSKRNRALANMELQFRKRGTTRVQTYRHIMANLDDVHLKTTPNALRYLETKPRIAAMTKAASFLLAFDAFTRIRSYLLERTDWMVSDASGVAPKWGKPAGFEYETYGTFARAEMDAGIAITPSWKAEFDRQPKRPLEFRFGYPDVNFKHNLIVMRRTDNAVAH